METLKAVTKAYTKFITAVLFLTAMLFSACDTSESGSGTGTMSVSLTDAPALYNAVNVEIHQVLVKGADSDEGSESDTTDADDTEGMSDEELEDDGWEVVFNDTLIVNLLNYQNGNTLPLGEVDVEAGRYEQIRLVLGDDNTVELLSGTTVDLVTPSAQSSGLKININADVGSGDFVELILDFDASQSVVVTGNGRYLLKPVIRAIIPNQTGSISGTVLPSVADTWVYTIADDDTVGANPDENGSFTLIGLEEGIYDVTFEPRNEVFADSTITGIELEANEEFEFSETVNLDSVSTN